MAQKESEKKIVDNEEVKNETEAQQTTAEASAGIYRCSTAAAIISSPLMDTLCEPVQEPI